MSAISQELPLVPPSIGQSRGGPRSWKIGTRIVRHDRYVVFQLAAVAVSRSLFAPGQ